MKVNIPSLAMGVFALLLATPLFAVPAQAATLPPYSFTDSNGQLVTLSYPQNSMTILHFWATWCVPCIKELPTLDDLAKKLATISSRQWRVVAVSLDDKQVLVSSFLKRHRITALEPNIDTTMQAMRSLGVGGLPTTMIIDDQGNEVKRFVGDYDWTTFDPGTLAVDELKKKPLY